MTHICIGKLTNLGSDNGLSPGRRQAIIWTSAGILLIGTLGTNFSEFLIGIQAFSFKKMHLKMLSAKWRPFCLGPFQCVNVVFFWYHCSAWENQRHISRSPLILHTLCCQLVAKQPKAGYNKEYLTLYKKVSTKYLWLAHEYCMNLFIQSFLSSGWTKTVTQSTAINYDIASKALLLLNLI